MVGEENEGKSIRCPRCLATVQVKRQLEEIEPTAVGDKKPSKRRRKEDPDEGDEDDEQDEETEEERPRRKKKKRRRAPAGDSWFASYTMAGWNILGLVLIAFYALRTGMFFVLISKLQKARPDLKMQMPVVAGQVIGTLIMVGIGVGLICKLESARKTFFIVSIIVLFLSFLGSIGGKNANMALVVGEMVGTVFVIVCGFLMTRDAATGLTVTLGSIPFLLALGFMAVALFYVLGLEGQKVLEFVGAP
jgi:hypothetical protein